MVFDVVVVEEVRPLRLSILLKGVMSTPLQVETFVVSDV